MLRPAWLLCVELQETRQVSFKLVQELTIRLASFASVRMRILATEQGPVQAVGFDVPSEDVGSA